MPKVILYLINRNLGCLYFILDTNDRRFTGCLAHLVAVDHDSDGPEGAGIGIDVAPGEQEVCGAFPGDKAPVGNLIIRWIIALRAPATVFPATVRMGDMAGSVEIFKGDPVASLMVNIDPVSSESDGVIVVFPV